MPAPASAASSNVIPPQSRGLLCAKSDHDHESKPMEFAPFDTRHYPTLTVQDGYREWAETYEATVLDLMDIRLLERLR
jgi:SAM-dependent methyltransferase